MHTIDDVDDTDTIRHADGDDDLVTALFARKTRKNKKNKNIKAANQAKKRPRSHFADDESDHEPVTADANSGVRKKNKGTGGGGGWERVEYKNADSKDDNNNNGNGNNNGNNIATSERRDAGTADNNKKKAAYGPRGAPANLRVTVRMDYQPDVCKDYKETGYCGFGDSCKFLHDRTDYKAGWQLEKDWVERTRLRNARIMRGEDPDKDTDIEIDDNEKKDASVDEDGLPFACFICRGRFSAPVVTLCEHYFCEDCAVARMRKEATCAVCKTELRGTLNTAHRLVAKLAKEGR